MSPFRSPEHRGGARWQGESTAALVAAALAGALVPSPRPGGRAHAGVDRREHPADSVAQTDRAADCAATHLTHDADEDLWQATFAVPAGSFEYKAALNDSWDVDYGAHAQLGGDNIALAHPAAGPRDVPLRRHDALGHRQRELRDRDRRGQLPVRARLHRRLGTGLSALVAAGHRRRRHLHVQHHFDPHLAPTR